MNSGTRPRGLYPFCIVAIFFLLPDYGGKYVGVMR